MPSNPRIAALSECRVMAANAAVEAYEITRRGLPEWTRVTSWEEIRDPFRSAWIDGFALLLSDLTRPESRDAWVRVLMYRSLHTILEVELVRNNPSALEAAIMEVFRG